MTAPAMPSDPSAHPNDVQHEVIASIKRRWSPYRYAPRTVEDHLLLRCFEAARWSASSFNDQPWFWLVAKREETEEFDRMLGCLLEANQGWARNAGVLVLTAIRTNFAHNGKPNRVALHDLGQAAAQLSLQAADLGLQVHQMAGINLSQIKQRYALPDGLEPQTAIAIGYPDTQPPADAAQAELDDRQNGPRKRKPLSEQVFTGKYGQPAGFVK